MKTQKTKEKRSFDMFKSNNLKNCGGKIMKTNNLFKKVVSVAVSFAIVGMSVPIMATSGENGAQTPAEPSSQQQNTVSNPASNSVGDTFGDFEVTTDDGTPSSDVIWDETNRVLTVISGEDVCMTISNKNSGTPTSDRIVINSDADLTFAGVNIVTNASATGAPVEITEPDYYVNITLADGTTNTLTSTVYNYAGLQENGVTGSLTITGSGELKATGGSDAGGSEPGAAGINVSNITIFTIEDGGTVTATGGNGMSGGAGINGSNIEIDGTVTATGGNGTNGGFGIDGFNIKIWGGTVEAYGGNGTNGGVGIYGGSGSKINGDAVVLALSGKQGVDALNGFDGGLTQGVVFTGYNEGSGDVWQTGNIYGSVTLKQNAAFPYNLTVGFTEYQTFTIDDGVTLTLNDNVTLTNDLKGKITNNGTITCGASATVQTKTDFYDGGSQVGSTKTYTYQDSGGVKTYGATGGLPTGYTWYCADSATPITDSTDVYLNAHMIATSITPLTGDFEVTTDDGTPSSDVIWDGANRVLVVTSGEDVRMTISNKNSGTPTSDRIVINSDADLTFAGVNIVTDASATGAPVEIINSDYKVYITLADGTTNTLTSTVYNYAGLQENGVTGSLTIMGSGELKATGGSDAGGSEPGAAGIDGSNITIFTIEDGGTVTAEDGGTVTATGGNGMSGGDGIYGDNIEIDGTVTATGGNGTNGGFGIDGFNIKIWGGTVEAYGGNGTNGADGICGDNIEIWKGTVTATGGNGTNGGFGIYGGSEGIINGDAVVLALSGKQGVDALGGFDDGLTQGVVFTGYNEGSGDVWQTGNIYGSVSLKQSIAFPYSLTVGSTERQTFTIDDGVTLTLNDNVTLTNDFKGEITNNGTITCGASATVKTKTDFYDGGSQVGSTITYTYQDSDGVKTYGATGGLPTGYASWYYNDVLVQNSDNVYLNAHMIATSITPPTGDFIVTKTDGGGPVTPSDVSWDEASGILTITSDTPMIISMKTPGTQTAQRIVINSASGATLTFAGINIGTGNGPPVQIVNTVSGSVTITLKDGTTNALTKSDDVGASYAGLQNDNKSGTLTIQGETAGTGQLTASGGMEERINGQAGINGGNIIIKGGIVESEGGTAGCLANSGGAGISGDNVTISGGIVTAIGGNGNNVGVGISGGSGSKIDGNAVVLARSARQGVDALNGFDGGLTQGVVFTGYSAYGKGVWQTGTMYGSSVTLSQDVEFPYLLTIGKDMAQTLTVGNSEAGKSATLTLKDNLTVDTNGTLVNDVGGTIAEDGGTIACSGSGTVKTVVGFAVSNSTAIGNRTYTYQDSGGNRTYGDTDGSDWTGLPEGYTWTNGTDEITNTSMVLLNAHTLEGEPETYDVDYTTKTEGGSISCASPQATVGQPLTVTASPDSGYAATGVEYSATGAEGSWKSADATASGDDWTFTVPALPADSTTLYLRGVFAQAYTVTIPTFAGGSVTADKTSKVVPGDEVTLTVTPDDGYQLKDGSLKVTYGDSEEITPELKPDTDNQYTFTMPADNVTVEAEFEQVPSPSPTPTPIPDDGGGTGGGGSDSGVSIAGVSSSSGSAQTGDSSAVGVVGLAALAGLGIVAMLRKRRK